MGVVLSTRVDHTLPLKLYDTTGDANVCVNDLVKDALSQLHHSCKDGRAQSAHESSVLPNMSYMTLHT